MTEEMSVTGAADLRVVALKVKAIGDRDLRLKLNRAIREATAPAKEAIRASAAANLPKRGGLAALVAESRVSSRTSTSKSRPGVKIVASNLHDIGAMDRGRLRHPVFGHKDRWVNQTIRAGWFKEPEQATVPVVRERISAALRDIQKELRN